MLMERKNDFFLTFFSPLLAHVDSIGVGSREKQREKAVDSINITSNPHLIKIVYDDICFNALSYRAHFSLLAFQKNLYTHL